jgi:hypothetical protein
MTMIRALLRRGLLAAALLCSGLAPQAALAQTVFTPYPATGPGTGWYLCFSGFRSGGSNDQVTLNTGASAFSLTQPTGYAAWDASGSTTWNPSDKSANITLSNSNLTASQNSATGAWNAVRSTSNHNAGLYYFEMTVDAYDAGNGIIVGLATSAASLSSWCGNTTASVGYQYGLCGGTGCGTYQLARTATQALGSTTTKVLGIAVNVGTGDIWIHSTGQSNWNNSASGNPVNDSISFGMPAYSCSSWNVSTSGLGANHMTGGSGTDTPCISNTFKSSGKFYYEVNVVGGAALNGNDRVGVGANTGDFVGCMGNGNIQHGGSTIGACKAFAIGFTMFVAVDAGAQKVYYSRSDAPTNWNNSTSNSPSTSTGGVTYGALTGAPNAYILVDSVGDATLSVMLNVSGTPAFIGTIPTGYSAWDTNNSTGGTSAPATTWSLPCTNWTGSGGNSIITHATAGDDSCGGSTNTTQNSGEVYYEDNITGTFATANSRLGLWDTPGNWVACLQSTQIKWSFQGSSTTMGTCTAPTSGNHYLLAVDIPDQLIWFASSASPTTWNNSTNNSPTSKTGGISWAGHNMTGMFPYADSQGDSMVLTLNTGGAFNQTPPTNYVGWSVAGAGGGFSSSLLLLGVGQ